MADQLLRERQDAAIWNAIEAENFKQALKLVDKRLAKKHTDYLEVSRYVRTYSKVSSGSNIVQNRSRD
jgi:N-terminal acetyltransferase B complex non-catalytic subunit